MRQTVIIQNHLSRIFIKVTVTRRNKDLRPATFLRDPAVRHKCLFHLELFSSEAWL